MTRLAVKEDKWIAAVGDILDHHGWRWHDTFPTRRTPGRWTPQYAAKGVPDLVAVRPPRVVWLELKTQTGRVTDEQASWIEGLQQANQEAYIIRVPGDWELLDEILRPDPEQRTLTGTTGEITWTQSVQYGKVIEQ